MLFVKGIVLGAVMFFVFSLIYLWAYGMIPTSSRAIGITALKSLTVENYLFWIAAALILSLGIVIMAMWPIKVTP